MQNQEVKLHCNWFAEEASLKNAFSLGESFRF
jgi:hypothetical protein